MLNIFIRKVFFFFFFNVSHSSLVLEFFETQSCDPKPVLTFNNNSEFENDNSDYDEDEDNIESDEDNNQNYNNKENYSNDGSNNNFEEADYNNDLMKKLRINNNIRYQKNTINDNDIGSYKGNNNGNNDDEVGLWWDEDNALNELTFDTMSSSFNNNYNNSNLIDSSNLFANADDLDCLENILSNYNLNETND